MAPTCTESGLTEGKKCAVCGEILIAQETVDAPGHTEEILPAVAPTCTESGLTEGKKCTVCGEILVAQETVDALGHNYIDGFCTGCGAAKPVVNPFVDVDEEDYFFVPVLWAVENQITNGTSADHFTPAAICNRAQVVTFLWRASGCPEPTISENPFVDVAEDTFFCKAVLWALENGITNGVDDTHFDPGDACNRAQVITFLWRAKGCPAAANAADFTDLTPGAFYVEAVSWAAENGITTGLGDGSFGAANPCNRAEIVTFLYRSCK